MRTSFLFNCWSSRKNWRKALASLRSQAAQIVIFRNVLAQMLPLKEGLSVTCDVLYGTNEF